LQHRIQVFLASAFGQLGFDIEDLIGQPVGAGDLGGAAL
jgi:hypothetical protein